MNGKKIACIILMMIVAGFAYSSQVMQKRTAAMKEQAEAADLDANTAQGAREQAEIKLKTLDYDTSDLRAFLKSWEPVISRIQSGQDAEQLIMGLVRNSGILVVSQKFELKDNRVNTLVPKILQGTLTVQDEYAKTMNWLGDLERKLPFARITSCRMKQGETTRQVSLELHFDVPLVNLEAQEEGKK
jgi:hypothetical protein